MYESRADILKILWKLSPDILKTIKSTPSKLCSPLLPLPHQWGLTTALGRNFQPSDAFSCLGFRSCSSSSSQLSLASSPQQAHLAQLGMANCCWPGEDSPGGFHILHSTWCCDGEWGKATLVGSVWGAFALDMALCAWQPMHHCKGSLGHLQLLASSGNSVLPSWGCCRQSAFHPNHPQVVWFGSLCPIFRAPCPGHHCFPVFCLLFH